MITRDSSLAFFVNQLNAFDSTIHEPLAAVTWHRDVKLRQGISLGNQSSSFVRAQFAHAGQQSAAGSHFINGGKNSSITAVGVDGTNVVLPIQTWVGEIRYTSLELERSQLTGVNLDDMQARALQMSYNMDLDRKVYLGDDFGAKGLLNNAEVTKKADASKTFAASTADEILTLVNALLKDAWTASGYAVCPNVLLLPPTQYAQIVGMKADAAAGKSVLTYLQENSMSLMINGVPLEVRPVKWLADIGGNTRMVAYNDSELYVRYPLAPIVRQTPYYSGITFAAPYVAGMGAVEFIYPETAIYQDVI